MPRPYPAEVRDICIHHYSMGFNPESISASTMIPKDTIQRYIARYKRYRTVLSQSELFGDGRGRPRDITDVDLGVTVFVWTRDPTLYFDEVAAEMSAILGKYIEVNNLRC